MKRLQFLMEDELVRDLDALVEETGLKTRTQLLNSALTLFEWAVRERKSGRVIASVDEKADKYKEIDLPGLPAVKQEEDIDTLLRQLGPLLKTDNQKQLAAELLGIGDIGPENLPPLEVPAIWAAYTVPAGAVDPPIAALKDRRELVGQAVAEACRIFGDARAEDPLIAALKDRKEIVRQAAAKVLGMIGDIRAVDPLIAALKDEDELVGQAAAEALADLAHNSKDEEVRRRAADGLAQLGKTQLAAAELGVKTRTLLKKLREQRGQASADQLQRDLDQALWQENSEPAPDRTRPSEK